MIRQAITKLRLKEVVLKLVKQIENNHKEIFKLNKIYNQQIKILQKLEKYDDKLFDKALEKYKAAYSLFKRNYKDFK